MATARSDWDRQQGTEVSLDRIGALWRARWPILAVVVVSVGLTIGGSLLVPKVYESSGQIMIKVPSTSQDGVLASSGLAAQYAEVVRAAPVIAPAARALGLRATTLTARTSAGTVAGQNLIQVTVQWGSRDTARKAADAVASSLVTYIDEQIAALTKNYQDVIDAQLAPLDQQIAAAQDSVEKARGNISKTNPASVADLTAAQSLLASLMDRRTALAAQSALQRASLRPQVETIGQAAAADQVQPRPIVYGAVAAIIALFVSGQVALALARRRLLADRRGTGAVARRT